MKELLPDFRYALRMLRRSPGFTLAAVACLALGIGATTAIFSVVNAVVLRPLPYKDSQRLVRIYTEFPTMPNGGFRKFWVSAPEFAEVKRDAKQWEAIEAWTTGGGINLSGTNEPVRVTSSSVSGGLFDTLGIAPHRGRFIKPEDDNPGSNLVVVISYGAWQRLFGGDPNIVNKQVQVNGNNANIVGVMPKGFQFPPGEVDPAEAWLPLRLTPQNLQQRGGHFLHVMGRPKQGVSFSQATQELESLVNNTYAPLAASQQQHMLNPKNHPLVYYPLQDEIVGNVRPAMLMMLAAVGFVLLIACGNVANLLLARAQARQREIAIRRAMGASTPGLVRQFVTEGLMLSVLGAGAGLLLAFGGLQLILAYGAESIPRAVEIGLDRDVLLFALAISITTGLFFGLAPLAQVVVGKLYDTLKSGGGRTTATRQAHWLRQGMVVGEITLALVLLIGAGLMIQAFWRLQLTNSGIRPENVLTVGIVLPTQIYPENHRVLSFWDQLQKNVQSIPGVVGATMATGLPPIRRMNANDTQIEGFVPREGGPGQNVDFYQGAGHKFFETLGIQLIEGRFFDERDAQHGTPAVIVNQTMAQLHWPNQSAIGRRLRPGFNPQTPWLTIVGVVADVKNGGLDRPAGTEIFFPFLQTQGGARSGFLLVRTQGDPKALARAIRAEVAKLDGSLPVANIRTMDQVMMTASARPRFLTLLITLFSTVALALAALGIYSVMSYSVAQRTNEFGIRMAMGAQQGDVLGLVVRQGMLLASIGVVLGLGGAVGLARVLKGNVYGITGFEPLPFALTALLLIAVTLAACLAPARRATRVDPLIALRYE